MQFNMFNMFKPRPEGRPCRPSETNRICQASVTRPRVDGKDVGDEDDNDDDAVVVRLMHYVSGLVIQIVQHERKKKK